VEFVRFASFDKSAARIFSERDVLEIELALLIDPLAGGGADQAWRNARHRLFCHRSEHDSPPARLRQDPRERSAEAVSARAGRPREIPIPMKKSEFKELLQGVRDAGAYLRGDKRAVTRVDRIKPDSVAVVRTKLKLSQSEFARMLGISVDTLQNGEQGRRQPSGAARVLLRVAAKHPEVVLEAVA
jgi:putative transcriptional regulator